MQNTYKGLSADQIIRNMQMDRERPATYWVTVAGTVYCVVAHRSHNARPSTLVLSTPDTRIVLRWSGKPVAIESMTLSAA